MNNETLLNVYDKDIYELRKEQTYYNTPKYIIYNTNTNKKVFSTQDKDILIKYLLKGLNSQTKTLQKALDKLKELNKIKGVK